MKPFDASVRKQIKKQAKQEVKSRLGSVIGTQILYSLPFAAIGAVLYFMLIARILVFAFQFGTGGMAGASEDAMMLASMKLIGEVVLMCLGAMVLYLLIGSALTFGLMQYFIRLYRGEKPTVGLLGYGFCGIRRFWNSIKLAVCIGFRSFLWMIIPTILYVVAAFGFGLNAAISGADPEGVIQVIYWVYVVVTMLIAIKIQTYYGAYILMDQNSSLGAWESTKQSSALFKGKYIALLVFELSYLPWYLLLIPLVLVAALLIGLTVMSSSVLLMSICIAAVVILALIYVYYLTAYFNAAFFGICDYLGMAPEKEEPEAADAAEAVEDVDAAESAAPVAAPKAEAAEPAEQPALPETVRKESGKEDSAEE